MRSKQYDLTINELKLLLKSQNIKLKKSYVHDDYIFTSFTMPWPLKNKLDRICKKYELTRSRVVQLLISQTNEEKFLEKYFEERKNA